MLTVISDAKYPVAILIYYKMAPSHPLRVSIIATHTNGASVSNISKTFSPAPQPYGLLYLVYLEPEACSKKYRSVVSLKKSLLKAWEEIAMEYVRAKLDAFLRRLKACIRAKESPFEI
ncbi:unnamed protein product [Heligmosomoides polygyrus]|uniref:ADF-H domain-containing protein n=1 Tax=Heligmosomoides polygyrus TaxID=6339 RepID=A0A183GNP7_HELPZ|nr:unnamed protein product [Heligmosomoides polygyrus]